MSPSCTARLAVYLMFAWTAVPAYAQDAPQPLSEDTGPEPAAPPPAAPAPQSEAPPAKEIPPPADPESPPPPAAAVAPVSEADPSWFEDLSLNAMVSGAFVHNFAKPPVLRGANVTRVFDADADSIKLDLAELVIQDEPENLGEAGFRVDIVHGQVVPAVIGGDDIALQQAYVSYIAPWGNGLRFDVGTFLSHIGAETIEGFDNVNDTYSRSLLFRAAPPELTGGRISYRFGDMLSATALVVNGWAPNIIDTNKGKSLGLQIAFNPCAEFAFFAHYMAGPEKPDVNGFNPTLGRDVQITNNDWRHLVDLVAVLRLHPVVITAEGMIGREQNAGAEDTAWGGALLSVRWDVGWGVTLVARGEYFDDRDNFTFLATQLVEASFGPSIKLTDNALVRLEYRHDHAVGDTAKAIFNTANFGVSTQQNTLAANAIFVF